MKGIITGAFFLLFVSAVSPLLGQTAEINTSRSVSWFPNPVPTKYTWTPTAFMLKKGTKYYQNSYIILNTIRYGVSDNFSIGVGIDPITAVATLYQQMPLPMFEVSLKFGYEIAPSFNFAMGAWVINFPLFSDIELIGNLYGVLTVGNENHNFSVGYSANVNSNGPNFEQIEGIERKSSLFTFSGQLRVFKYLALVSENMYTLSNDRRSLYSGGLKIIGPTWTIDISITSQVVPYLGFVYVY